MTKRAAANAKEGDHLVRRVVNVGKDEVLGLDDDGKLGVATTEFEIINSDGDYHCTCGDTFEGQDGAEAHLQEVRGDGS